MKIAVALVGLSLAVMVVMIFQAVRQEMNLRDLKSRMMANAADARRKESVIMETKEKIKKIKSELQTVNTKVDTLQKTKGEKEKSAGDLDASLNTCKAEKDNAEKKKTETGEALAKLKADHEAAKTKAEEDIKNLKQQILDRDKAICAFADITKEEARKLCGISEAPK